MRPARFTPGDRVVLVAREPSPPPPQECGRLGTFVEYVLEPYNTFYNDRFNLRGYVFCRVEWDAPMQTLTGKHITKHCLLECHIDPYQPPKDEPRTEERTDYIDTATRRIFTDPRPVLLREFPAKPEKVKA